MSGNTLAGLSSGNRSLNGLTDTGSTASLTVGDELKLKTTSQIIIDGATYPSGREGDVIKRVGDGITWVEESDTKGVAIKNKDMSDGITILHPTFILDYAGTDKSEQVEMYTAKNTLILDPSNAIFAIHPINEGKVGIGTSSPGAKLEIIETDICNNGIAYPLILDHRLSSGTPTPDEGIGTGIYFRCQRDTGANAHTDRKIASIEGYGAANIPGPNDQWNLRFKVRDNDDIKTPLVLKHDGNVGIGTTDPQTSLDINGDGTNCLALRNGNSATAYTDSQILLSYNGNAYNSGEGLDVALGGYSHKIQSRHQSGISHTQNAIDFYLWKNGQSSHEIGNTHGMSITAGGVGIGTTDPKENLEISGDTARLRIYDGTASRNPGIEFVRGSTTFGGDEYSDWRIHNDGGKLKFYTKNDGSDGGIDGDVMSLKYNGNVGIGTTSPDSLLHIKTITDRGTTNTTNLTMLTLESNPLTDDCATYDWNPISIDFKMANRKDNVTTYENIARISAVMCPTGGSNHNTQIGEGSNALTFWTSKGSSVSPYPVTTTEKMRINHDGNVGIGTTNPRQNLQVNGTIAVVAGNAGYGLHLSSTGSNVDPNDSVYLGFSHGADANNSNLADSNIRASIGLNVKSGGNGRLVFRTGSKGSPTERMRIDDGGNVGIGTTDPSGKLHVYNGNILLENSGSNALDNKIIFREAGYDDRFFIATDLADAPSNQQSLRFGFTDGGDADITNENALVNIRGDGNVGIGTTSPEGLLHLKGTPENSEFKFGTEPHHLVCKRDMCFNSKEGTFRFRSITNFDGDSHRDSSSHTNLMTINSNGVGIGTTDPGDYTFKVDGSANITGNLTAGTITGNVTGDLAGNATTATTATTALTVTNGVYTTGDQTIDGSFTLISDADTQFLVKPTSTNSNDANIEIRGARNGATDKYQASITLSNYDMDPKATHILGRVAGKVSNSTTNVGNLILQTSSNGSTLADTMVLKHDGKVGIGTTDPNHKLDVAGKIKAVALEIDKWVLVTELNKDDPMNNPWNGTKETGAPTVIVPLNTISSSNGTDLEIKIEWDNNDGTTSSRFYKGWYLNEVFDYTRGISDGTVGTVYAKWNENDNWYESTQHSKNGYTNKRWNWMFNENDETELAYTDTLTGKIGYHNVGFLLHGSSSNTEIANGIYSGGDEYRTGKYSDWQSWSKVRVYVAGALTAGGKVGIGTTDPQTSLQIYKDVATGRDEVFRLTTNTGGGCGPLMRFTSYHTSGDNPSIDEYNLAGIAGYDSTGTWGGSLTFSTAPEGDHGGSNLIERMTINDQGNVSMSNDLTVSGNLTVDSDTRIKGTLKVGVNTAPTEGEAAVIKFQGINSDSTFEECVIANRVYATNKSELILFKGNDVDTHSHGPDRIRLRAGEIILDTFSQATPDVPENQLWTNESPRLTIASNGNVSIANDLTVSGTITGNGSGLTNITKTAVGLGNVANVNLGNVTNESKADMFTSPTFTGSPTVDGPLILEGGTTNKEDSVSTRTDGDASEGETTRNMRENSYIHFGRAGSGNDWAILRQDGSNNHFALALDFHDDSNDVEFLMRSVHSSGNDPDKIEERFRFSDGVLQMRASISGSQSQLTLHKQFTESGIYNSSGISFTTTNGTTKDSVEWGCGYIGGYIKANNNTVSGFPGGLVFKTKSPDSTADYTFVDRMVIDANGNVGIGTTTPGSSYKLDVNGNANITGQLDADSIGTLTGTDNGLDYIKLNNKEADSAPLSGAGAGTLAYDLNYYTTNEVGYDTSIDTYLTGDGSVIVGAVPTINGSSSFNDGNLGGLMFRDGTGWTMIPSSRTLKYLHTRLCSLGVGVSPPGTEGNLTVGGKVGVGTSNPVARLHVQGIFNSSTNSQSSQLAFAVTTNGYANGENGLWGINFMKGGNSNDYNAYLVMVDDGNGNLHRVGLWENNSHNTNKMNFTGQHRCIANNNLHASMCGLIVSSTGKYLNIDNSINATMNESLPICEISNKNNDKKVFGVISDDRDDNEERTYGQGNYKSIQLKTNRNENRLHINSVGEGSIWVSNINGNIENGDYITSSTIPGYGQLQNDDLLHNYTVAKITCDCNFSLTKIVKQKLKTVKIMVDQVNTNVNSNEEETIQVEKQEIVYDQNGDTQYEADLDASGNQQMVYEHETRFLDASGNQLQDETEYNNKKLNNENVYIACFVGCTYHCG